VPLTEKAALDRARYMIGLRQKEQTRLDRIHNYLRGTYQFSWLPTTVPNEVKRIAEIARVNVLSFVVNSSVQSLYVDGFRKAKESENQQAWETWQRNGLDARQTGVHRASLAYGASYTTILPGDNAPVIRGASPRKMTVAYGTDDQWPEFALEKRRGKVPEKADDPQRNLFRLFDTTHAYWFSTDGTTDDIKFEYSEEHGVGRVPVVRFLSTEDLDDEVIGEVEPLYSLQEQINMTTFGLLVAQHYGAFRQRYIIGWLADSEAAALKAGASRLWTFADDAKDIKVGEFDQTELDGYIESREATIRHLATISQTPVHELLGQLVNLSAEALVAARDSKNRMNAEKQVLLGEPWEQTLGTAGELMGAKTDPSATVRWRDMEARSLAQTADALGKLAKMLAIPVQELWERVPGVTDQEIQRWKKAAESSDAFSNLEKLLQEQSDETAGV
jgi:hypothetical protein